MNPKSLLLGPIEHLRARARHWAIKRIVPEYVSSRPVGEFALQWLAVSQHWICRELLEEDSQLRPSVPLQRNLSKTFELADFSIALVRQYAKSIIDYLGPIDYQSFPYSTRLGPIMNGHAYVKIWEVAYLAAVSGIGRGDRILIPASGPSYWIPAWHKEVLGCEVTCFDKSRNYNDFTVDETVYGRYGIEFSYQDAGDFHFEGRRFDAILSHCSIEHFFGGACVRFVQRADRYLVDGGVLGCATQIWNPDCSLIGREVPELGYIFFSVEAINELMGANPSLHSLDGRPFICYQHWPRYNVFEVDPGRYSFDGETCKTLCCAFFLKRDGLSV